LGNKCIGATRKKGYHGEKWRYNPRTLRKKVMGRKNTRIRKDSQRKRDRDYTTICGKIKERTSGGGGEA